MRVCVSAPQQVVASEVALALAKVKRDEDVALANVAKEAAVQQRRFELGAQIERANAAQATEHMRAEIAAKATVEAEALRTRTTVEADMVRTRAAAEADQRRLMAEATLFSETKKAEGVRIAYEAESTGLATLVATLGSPAAAIDYIMIHSGTRERLAETSAKAIQDLHPTITVWDAGNSGAATNVIRDIMNAVPPIATFLRGQGAGLTAPPPPAPADA